MLSLFRMLRFFSWCDGRAICDHGDTGVGVQTVCEEAELPSLALAASFCLSSLISFSSSLSPLSSWVLPLQNETDRTEKKHFFTETNVSFYK